MTLIEHTAYSRLKRTLTLKELDQIYTPAPVELFLAHRTAKGPIATLGFLIHLKGTSGTQLDCPKQLRISRPKRTDYSKNQMVNALKSERFLPSRVSTCPEE